jgi:hypothetical protein
MIKIFKCEYCNKAAKKEATIALHEKNCVYNYTLKHCFTCTQKCSDYENNSQEVKEIRIIPFNRLKCDQYKAT